MSSREPPLGFSLQFPNLQEAKNSSPKKGGRTRFPLFKWPLSLYSQPKFYAGLYSSHQEMCRSTIWCSMSTGTPISERSRWHSIFEQLSVWQGLVDHGVQFLTSDCTLSHPRTARPGCCQSCWPLMSSWPPSSTVPAPLHHWSVHQDPEESIWERAPHSWTVRHSWFLSKISAKADIGTSLVV